MNSKLNEVILYIVITLTVMVLFGWALSNALRHFDTTPQNVVWVKYKIKKNIYLWNLIVKEEKNCSLTKQIMVILFQEKNHLKSNLLKKGEKIWIISPNKC